MCHIVCACATVMDTVYARAAKEKPHNFKGGTMSVHTFKKNGEFRGEMIPETNFLSTHVLLDSGASMLTSVDYGAARRLLSNFKNTGKGRLIKKRDGRIELIDSLWRDYGDTHTDLHDINDLIRIKDRIFALCRNADDRCRSIVIVDWGCGAGHTLTQLDAWLRKMGIDCVKLYGFANEFHPDWHKAPANITFILDVAENLPKYFNTRTVDFIYSIAGLYYLFIPESDSGDDDMLEYFKKHRFDGSLFKNYTHTERHLEALSFIMKYSGELIIDLPVHVIDIDYNLLKTENRYFTTHRNPEVYGEHAYVLVPSLPGLHDGFIGSPAHSLGRDDFGEKAYGTMA